MTKSTEKQKATVTQVQIGPLTIEGLMAEDGTFGVAVPQIAATFSFPIKHASRDIKASLAKDSRFPKKEIHLLQWKTELNSKAVNVLTLDQFSALALSQYNKGNEFVDTLVKALFGLSLHQLFSDAFGQKFEAEERQAWLTERLAGKKVRRTLTDAIWDYISRHAEEVVGKHRQYLFANTTNAMYREMFGATAKQIREAREVGDGKLTRDWMSEDELRHIASAEDFAMRLIDEEDMPPMRAAKEVVQTLRLTKKHLQNGQ